MSAVNNAHLHSIGVAPEDQPTIFDIYSQENLASSIKPALKHIMKFLTVANPLRYGPFLKNFDEYYLCFDFVLQNYFLRKYGASFSENFYSIKRVMTKNGKMPTEFRDRLRCLAIQVLWPYAQDKLDVFHDRWKELLDYRQWAQCSLRDKMKKVFLAIWPWFKSFMMLLKILLNIGYLTSRTTIHSPFLWLAGVRLEKLTAEDIESFESIPMHLRQSGIFNRLWRFVLGLPGVLSRLFAYGLFFFQFIDYLYNSDMGTTIMKKNALWTPPPAPHKLLMEEEVQSLDTYKCPLCLKRRVNDTVLSVSGYVFCFNCIDTHIKKYNACPVTGLPATNQQLIRLYIQ